ncbi:TetR/AcrR family transcriptional regulator [Streptomyces sp. NPDC014734]|uniref:TetR/AcrR family transcriptional regulator n=1 Tax=Streptomyces sp. NPDC014734 TaxID=3364886 RepID=UPI003702AEF1
MTDGRTEAPPPGRRERKKRELRNHISGVATRLFLERGFEGVTVAEVAEAADVSTMTVFNHFPRKENLFLDRGPEIAELLTSTVRDREQDEPPLAALRRMSLRLIDERHPLSGLVDGMGSFLQVVLDSPALSSRWREMGEEAAVALAEALARAAGRPPHDPEARYTATSVQTIRDTVFREAARRTSAGETVDAVHADLRALADRLFDVLEQGVGADWGLPTSPPRG